ncbi:hypothetical protein MAR_027657 [Mya arenaria]|uniref:Uncharacterized protein n=1 Tax=Mya arenaria TaxID=6604 RepID=A0ABY7EU36_MYAAR|nr:hypothetical protein MAR_027657 [Mya arenaria]
MQLRKIDYLEAIRMEKHSPNCAACVDCKSSNDQIELSKLGEKGCKGLIGASDCLTVQPGQYVHKECRRQYCHPSNDRTPQNTEDNFHRLQRRCRTEENKFDFIENCFFCGTVAKIASNKRGNDVFPVRTLEFQNNVRDFCKRRTDEWSENVIGRLEYAQDLPAVEARYHQKCSINFRTGRSLPIQYRSIQTQTYKKGRPSSRNADTAFQHIMEYLEERVNDQVTISDLVHQMQELCGEEAYSTVYMKKEIIDFFGCEIINSELDGKPNVIPFKGTADSILHSFHRSSSKANTESEKNAVIKTAAKLIIKDIKDMQFSKEIYPSVDEMITIETNKKYVPSSLMLFLEHLVTSKNADTKTIAIGQSIVQSAIPRGAILPLQLGFGVQIHHHFGSKFVVDTLNSLGFSSSYTEVQKYEAAAATNWSIGIEKEQTDKAFQCVADDVDHNLATVDGHNTFHGMGIIATILPGVKSSRVIPRLSSTTEDLLSVGKINVTLYSPLINNFSTLTFQSLNEVNDVIDQTQNLEQLVDISRPLKTQCPSWSGFMQTTQTGRHPGKSTVLFLPMIDLNSSDLSCIYSSLDFVATQAKTLSVSPIVTFDQPLYWKSVQMVMNEPENSTIKAMVIRLCGFHTQMSFLGCIGHLMQNSGLQELIDTVYATNTVTHMLSGKEVSRAVRGHILVDSALKSLLVERVFSTGLSE